MISSSFCRHAGASQHSTQEGAALARLPPRETQKQEQSPYIKLTGTLNRSRFSKTVLRKQPKGHWSHAFAMQGRAGPVSAAPRCRRHSSGAPWPSPKLLPIERSQTPTPTVGPARPRAFIEAPPASHRRCASGLASSPHPATLVDRAHEYTPRLNTFSSCRII